MRFGKYLANDGADNIGHYWITLEKTSINVLASRFNVFVVFIELSPMDHGLLSRWSKVRILSGKYHKPFQIIKIQDFSNIVKTIILI